LPIIAGVAVSAGLHPFVPMAAAALAASFAFMLPVATPPNAIVFASGQVTIPQMAKAGLWLNLSGVVLILLFVSFWLPWVWELPLG
jgi:sodium-dependent dicarboxylate transporter 2/3/5